MTLYLTESNGQKSFLHGGHRRFSLAPGKLPQGFVNGAQRSGPTPATCIDNFILPVSGCTAHGIALGSEAKDRVRRCRFCSVARNNASVKRRATTAKLICHCRIEAPVRKNFFVP